MINMVSFNLKINQFIHRGAAVMHSCQEACMFHVLFITGTVHTGRLKEASLANTARQISQEQPS